MNLGGYFKDNVTHEARGVARSEAARHTSSLSMRLLGCPISRKYAGSSSENN